MNTLTTLTASLANNKMRLGRAIVSPCFIALMSINTNRARIAMHVPKTTPATKTLLPTNKKTKANGMSYDTATCLHSNSSNSVWFEMPRLRCSRRHRDRVNMWQRTPAQAPTKVANATEIRMLPTEENKIRHSVVLRGRGRIDDSRVL